MLFDIYGDLMFLHRLDALKYLLIDKTVRWNILWGTDAYAHRGLNYAGDQEMQLYQITGENSGLLRIRAQKQQNQRQQPNPFHGSLQLRHAYQVARRLPTTRMRSSPRQVERVSRASSVVTFASRQNRERVRSLSRYRFSCSSLVKVMAPR